ncbi:MAG: hypothetical protein LBP59_15710 [Planctomycetaceae bacterium]|nr:hypothetical protein [Planctomycetaceae bacterium]
MRRFFITKNRQPDRGRLACKRLYSTANERVYILNSLFVCLLANCRQDVCDPATIFVIKKLSLMSHLSFKNYQNVI